MADAPPHQNPPGSGKRRRNKKGGKSPQQQQQQQGKTSPRQADQQGKSPQQQGKPTSPRDVKPSGINLTPNSKPHQLSAESPEFHPQQPPLATLSTSPPQVSPTSPSQESAVQRPRKVLEIKNPVTGEVLNKDSIVSASISSPPPSAAAPLIDGEASKAKGQEGRSEAGGEQKTKAQLKAERRAIQEAQRAAKLAEEGKDQPQEQKSKAQLKAERRALQEAQRAAKTGGGVQPAKTPAAVKSPAQSGGGSGGGGGGGSGAGGSTNKPPVKEAVSSKDGPRVPDHMQMDNEQMQKKLAKKLERQHVPQRSSVSRKVALFGHLHQYGNDASLTRNVLFSSESSIHPAILRLGLQYADGVICGSNSRCIALLAAMKQVIKDYTTPPHKELSRDLEAKIEPYISFLTQCRSMSVSMGNAIRYLKYQITRLRMDLSESEQKTAIPDSEAKERLTQSIDVFIQEKIEKAGEMISKHKAIEKIWDGDVILVYSYSSLIKQVLCDAHKAKKKFSVIVVDGRPKLEGRLMLRKLVQEGIKCSYVLINTVSYVMPEVTKVFLGAHALLANGYVMSRCGNSQVAVVAKSYNVPVLVCCETYKFCERAQTDSFVYNELGDPNDLVRDVKSGPLSSWQETSSLGLLNLMYDVTPPELITIVITELGMIPCTSVPVVLRVKHVET